MIAYAVGLATVRNPSLRIVQSDLVYGIPDLAGVVAACWMLWRRDRLTGWAVSPVALLGIACGLSFAADILYAGYYYVDGRTDVFPSWADPIWLAADVALVLAIASAFRAVHPLRRIRGALDALVAGFGLAAALWVTGIADPAGQGLIASAITVSYPAADLVMLVIVLSVGMGGHRRLPLALTLLGASSLVLVATDLTSAYTTAFDAYTTGSWLELGWQGSGVLTVLAIIGAARTPDNVVTPPGVDPSDQVDGAEALILDRDALGLAPLLAGVAGAFFVVVAQATSGASATAALLLAAVTVVLVFVRLLLSIADQRAVSRRLDDSLREQKQLAITDMLTDLYNRRFIEEVLRLEASRAIREGRPLAVMLLDIDAFKRVNDTYGHQAGDHVLAEAAARIRRAMRNSDMIGRWGGEEFLAVFPNADVASAMRGTERIRQALSGETIRLIDGTRIRVTASAGIATLSQTGDVDTLLWQVDQALYAAKGNGRDCAHAWNADGFPVSALD